MATPLSVTHQTFLYLHFYRVFSIYEGVINYGLVTKAKLAGPLICIKDTGKLRNQQVEKSQIVLIHVKYIILWQLIHGCKYCFIDNSNKLCLLVSGTFWLKKEWLGRQMNLEETVYGLELVCPFLRHMQLHHTDRCICIVSYSIVEERNYSHYKWHTLCHVEILCV